MKIATYIYNFECFPVIPLPWKQQEEKVSKIPSNFYVDRYIDTSAIYNYWFRNRLTIVTNFKRINIFEHDFYIESSNETSKIFALFQINISSDGVFKYTILDIQIFYREIHNIGIII